MGIRSKLALCLVATLASQVVTANPHPYDVTFDGTALTTNQTSAGQQLADGETVTLDLHAAGDGYWTFAGGPLWAPIGMVECGTRVGDFSLSLLLDGVVVASAGYTDQGSACVHISNAVDIPGPVIFDELFWTFVQTSTDTSPNTLNPPIFEPEVIFPFFGNAPVFVPPVPEPPTPLLVVAGLVLLTGFSRRGYARVTNERENSRWHDWCAIDNGRTLEVLR